MENGGQGPAPLVPPSSGTGEVTRTEAQALVLLFTQSLNLPASCLTSPLVVPGGSRRPVGQTCPMSKRPQTLG